MKFDVEQTIRARKSVRSYENRPLSQTDKAAVNNLISGQSKERTTMESVGYTIGKFVLAATAMGLVFLLFS